MRAMVSRQKAAAEDYERAQKALRDERAVLDALAELDAMASEPWPRVAGFALESAVRLTGSTIGWVGVLSDDESKVIKHLWSDATAAGCLLKDMLHSISVREGGAWNRPIVERKPAIVNDVSQLSPGESGTPAGHIPMTRFLGIPVFGEGRVRAIAEVGNKEADYDQQDVQTVALLFASAWRIMGQKRVESSLESAHRQFELLFDVLGKGIYSMDLIALTELEIALGAKAQLDLTSAEDRRMLVKPLETLVSITGIIDDIKAIYRTRRSLQLINMDLGQVLADVKEEYATVPEGRIKINYLPSYGHCVRANELLKTVFTCLIDNAIKSASPAHPLAIDLAVTGLWADGRDYYAVTLEINGPGLCDQPGSLCENGEACRGGVQFALIKTLVGHFDGRMWVESRVRGEPEKGCRATVMLPKASSIPALPPA